MTAIISGGVIMAHDGKFQIEWDDFTTACMEKFGNALGRKDFSDVTLVSSDGKRIPGHLVILASGCTFFKEILDGEESHKPLIFFRGTNSALLESLLSFLYKGSTEVAEDEIDQFMVLAEELGVDGLAKSDNQSGQTVEDTRTTMGEHDSDSRLGQNGRNGVGGGTESKDIKTYFKPSPDIKGWNNHIGTFKEKINPQEGKPQNFDVKLPERDKDGLFQCFGCEAKIGVKSNFRRHVRKYHLKIDFQCEHCDYKTLDASYMSRHRKTCVKREDSVD